jgi:isoleucyl-tRNA synthetase
VHGVLLGNDRQKLSKRLGNYPDPIEVFDTVGSDAMRWALLSSAAVRGGDMVADRKPMEDAVRQVLMPIWNAWYFLSLYANAADRHGNVLNEPPGSNILDRYAFAKVRELRDDVTAKMDDYDLSGACASILRFVDSLNNWYIRRSRDRFWAGDGDAIDTLHSVLSLLLRIAAPLLPLTTDAVWAGLIGVGSVHLEDWPTEDEAAADATLVRAMDDVREVCSAAASVRRANSVPNRQPLARLTVDAGDHALLEPFVDLIRDEANVKDLDLRGDSTLGRFEFKLVPSKVGPRLGKDSQRFIKAAPSDMAYDADAGTLTVFGEQTFVEGEFVRELVADDPASTAEVSGFGLVRLDLTVTPELEAEGLARFVIRQLNELRKAIGLHVSDRVHLVIDAGSHDDVRAALEANRESIQREVLAADVVFDGPVSDGRRIELPDGRAIHDGLHVVG